MLIFFVFSLVFINYIEFYLNKTLINVVSMFSLPYLIIVPINNLVMVKFGFYPISDKVIGLLTLCLYCIFIGSIIVNARRRISTRLESENKVSDDIFDYYRMDKIVKWCLFTEILEMIKIFVIVRNNGLAYLSTNEYSGELFHGIIGHIFLSAYTLIPICFYYWLKNKKEYIYFLSSVLGVGICFLSFVKYHAIGMIILVFIFVTICDHKYFLNGALTLLIVVVLLFVSNYFISFLLRGVSGQINQNYYFQHFWNYAAGSLIYDNSIFAEGIYHNQSLLYKICTCIFAFPRMFTSKLTDPIFPYELLPYRMVGSNHEAGNVVDAFGYFWPYHADAFSVIGYIIFLLLIGLLFTIIYNHFSKDTVHLPNTLCTFLTFYVVLSFFGTFYALPTCWEILLLSFVIAFFDKRIVFIIHKH